MVAHTDRSRNKAVYVLSDTDRCRNRAGVCTDADQLKWQWEMRRHVSKWWKV